MQIRTWVNHERRWIPSMMETSQGASDAPCDALQVLICIYIIINHGDALHLIGKIVLTLTVSKYVLIFC